MSNKRETRIRHFFTRFDKIYVINREKDTARRALITSQLDPICDEYTLFPATDGWAEDIPFIETKENMLYEGWTRGAAGLVDTTIKIVDEAVKNGYEQILIMEDDLVFNSFLFKADDVLAALPGDWELFHLASNDYKRSRRQGKLRKLAGAWSCQMYAVHSRAYKEYLEQLRARDKPIDLVTSAYFHPKGNSYSARYDMVNTVPNLSSIRDKFVHYT